MINIKELKLHLVQCKYRFISEVILKLEKHLDNLLNSYFIDYSYKNHILDSIFEINKNLNSEYNQYILNIMDTDNEIDKDILLLFASLPKNIDNSYLFKNISQFFKVHNNNLPLMKIEKQLMDIIYDIGYNSLLDAVNICTYYKFNLNTNQQLLVDELTKSFIPTKIRFFNVSNRKEDYYWSVPRKFENNDLLELTRELWIKNPNSDTEYLKIEGQFINDSLSTLIKTSQINYPILNTIKHKVLELLKTSSVDFKFIKKFLRYDYLGNIYTLSASLYIKYIDDCYQKYLELTHSSFINIMKDFIAKGSQIKKIYEDILLLLFGSNDNIDIAGLLINLTKEKKINSPQIFNLITQRLPYYLQIKIKKSSNNIKNEIEKLKSLTMDDVDYKKQLILNNNIPNNVKTLTLEKIEEMKTMNNEYYKQLTFVKHILLYPWQSDNIEHFYQSLHIDQSKACSYLTNVETKLKELSYGHLEAKKSLLEIIGKWISNPSSQGTSLGLVGPPGVGKTLLAKSVSSALNIPFAEITLGGQNDGEILHGHGYTYSGSQPGLIIKKMVEMGSSRCILYFDELDKACSKHGSINEITSILIHLTDHNMNKTFQDRFFQGVDFPLDKVIMIFSYNDSSLVDPILLDRLKQIEICPYTINDKIKIVKNFIINEVAKTIGLEKETWIDMDDELIEFIIDKYTSEAGVRSIKRKIEKIFLTLNLDKIYKRNYFTSPLISITKEMVVNILDKSDNDNTKIHNSSYVGIVNGLYATSNGDGGIIPIQIFNNFSTSNDSFNIMLTGKQGDTMKESVLCSLTAAIDYIQRNKLIDNIQDYMQINFKHGFHVHAPATSTPKDGPSAGGAFTTAFISRILGRKIRNDIAMTGEIDLMGNIMKIGGLNYKLIGAKKAGVKIVLVPEENKKDLDTIHEKYPNLINDDFQVKIVSNIDSIISIILED